MNITSQDQNNLPQYQLSPGSFVGQEPGSSLPKLDENFPTYILIKFGGRHIQ